MYPTILTAAINETLDYAINRQACVLIQGRTGRGKTVAVTAWAARKRDAYYIDCPVSTSTETIASAVASTVGTPSNAALEAFLSSHRCILILDECARLIPSRAGRARALEYLRRLHDRTGVALAFVATDYFMRECSHTGLGDYLEQFIGRFRDKLIIPDFISREECTDILKPYITPTDELVDFAYKTANDRGRGGARRLWWLLQDASAAASRARITMDLKFLRAALADYEGRDRLPVSPTSTSSK